MDWMKWRKEENKEYEERHQLSVDRLKAILTEETTAPRYRSFFQDMSVFLLELEAVRRKVEDGTFRAMKISDKESINQTLYSDIVGERYEKSFANPACASRRLGEKMGPLLSCLYAELRAGIPYAFEDRLDYLTIHNELFLEIYRCFEESPEPEYTEVKNIFYWYASDYCDVFVKDRIEEQIYPGHSFAVELIKHANLDEDGYLYCFGEYVTENERKTARHLRSLPEETIRKMADVFTEGYRVGFLNTGKDLSKKSVVNIRYTLGFEKVVKRAIDNFAKMGLKPVIYRAASSVITKKEQYKIGYYGGIPNKQYDYDHRSDQAFFLDKRYIERKLSVLRDVYEKNQPQAAKFAGPAVMEVFGETPFTPEVKKEAPSYNERQRKLLLLYESKSGQIVNQYIKGDERSYTIISYPVPEIGDQYPGIFDETVRINTLDAALYRSVQQTLIDALDKGEYVRVTGKDENETNIRIKLHPLRDKDRETNFENCVADVNIPVGEVFTSPVLEGTEGILHVKKVYLNGLQYRDLKLVFKEGHITEYSCSNFTTPEENKNYIRSNLLHGHESLPLGEFAIGTNTTAYVAARKYGIEDKMPILIAEKTGPHFAVGDTCYSWSEEIPVYNPDGKEVIARDNSVSIRRREDPEKAYYQCHTDITLPYEELEEISVVTKEGKEIILLKDGRFVLKGTEILNEPLDKAFL